MRSQSRTLNSALGCSVAVSGFTLPSAVNLADLIDNAVASQVNFKSKRLKVSATSAKIFQIGSPSTSQYIQVGAVKEETNPSSKCLCIVSRVKETKPKFISLMNKRNLGLEDIHAFAIRDSFEALNDCELKTFVLNYIKAAFNIPSKEKLKADKGGENSKVIYVRNALKSALKHLADPVLSAAIANVIDDFIKKLPKEKFKAQKLGVTTPEEEKKEGLD